MIDLRVAKFQKPRAGAAGALVLVHLEQPQRIPCHVLFLLCSESGASWLKKKQQPSPVPVRLTVIPEKIPGGVTSLRLQARTASLLSTQERKNAKAMLPHFLPTSKKFSCTFHCCSPITYCCSPSGMGKHLENAATVKKCTCDTVVPHTTKVQQPLSTTEHDTTAEPSRPTVHHTKGIEQRSNSAPGALRNVSRYVTNHHATMMK